LELESFRVIVSDILKSSDEKRWKELVLVTQGEATWPKAYTNTIPKKVNLSTSPTCSNYEKILINMSQKTRVA
jgi:hypothetical protein